MASTGPQSWARVRGVPGMHLPGLQPGRWYRVVEAPQEMPADMMADVWAHYSRVRIDRP